jgi:hypothetical protein
VVFVTFVARHLRLYRQSHSWQCRLAEKEPLPGNNFSPAGSLYPQTSFFIVGFFVLWNIAHYIRRSEFFNYRFRDRRHGVTIFFIGLGKICDPAGLCRDPLGKLDGFYLRAVPVLPAGLRHFFLFVLYFVPAPDLRAGTRQKARRSMILSVYKKALIYLLWINRFDFRFAALYLQAFLEFTSTDKLFIIYWRQTKALQENYENRDH